MGTSASTYMKRHFHQRLFRMETTLTLSVCFIHNLLEFNECFICFTEFKEIKLIGIQSECNHIFCFSCLKKLRQSRDKRCPICRKTSAIMFPSQTLIHDKNAKEEAIQKFRGVLKEQVYCKENNSIYCIENCPYKHAQR